MISGSGTSTLDDLPDMFVGDMTISGHIGAGDCRSTSKTALVYPNPGEALTITEVEKIPFKEATPGNCFAKGQTNQTTSASTPSSVTTLVSSSSSSTSTIRSSTTTTSECRNSFPTTFKILVGDKPKSCSCFCEN